MLKPLTNHLQASAFCALPPTLYSYVTPTPLSTPTLALFNHALAQCFGIESPETDRTLSLLLAGIPHPQCRYWAADYAGHQFGVWVPQLGDGRAIHLGEIVDTNQTRHEVQLKGSGPTPFSRRGDGRAVLRSSLREYLCSEAMAGLNIPTTRALALISSPQTVWRETQEPTAIVTRTAPSFIRFGSFERFAHCGDHHTLNALAQFVLTHFYPECQDAEDPIAAMFQIICQRSAELVAAWQAVGFCHGVLNTDNMSILGLTLDYGPFSFLDGFDSHFICNHSDPNGRYAFDAQPGIVHWNLQCLASALLPLSSQDALVESLNHFPDQFEHAFGQRLQKKCGFTHWKESDWPLFSQLVALLEAERTDYTLFWRTLSEHATQPAAVEALFSDRKAIRHWLTLWQARCQSDQTLDAAQIQMRAHNPKYILRNHLAEMAIRAAHHGDFSIAEQLINVLQSPYDDHPAHHEWAKQPPDWARHLVLSCSS